MTDRVSTLARIASYSRSRPPGAVEPLVDTDRAGRRIGAAERVERLREVHRWAACIPVAAPRPRPWPVELRPLQLRIAGAGRSWEFEEWLEATATTALLVVVDGTLVFEQYFFGVTPADRLLGYSATKSALAVLLGLAYRDGTLGDLSLPAIRWVPELAGSGYERVSVEQLASMTSGVGWEEDYRDPTGPAARLLARWQGGRGGVRDVVAGLPARDEPGTAFCYSTPDSLVLDWVRERATGQPFAEAMGELWEELGAEREALVCLDAPPEQGGVAFAGAGLAATARDWARLGECQRTGRAPGASADARPVLSAEWLTTSSRPAAEFLLPGRLPSTITTHAGFGFHWWALDPDGETLTADGMQGQFVYVDRPARTVVVKTSAWPHQDPWQDRQWRDLCYLGLPAIARAAAGHARAQRRRECGRNDSIPATTAVTR